MHFEAIGIAGRYPLAPERRDDGPSQVARIHCEWNPADRGVSGSIRRAALDAIVVIRPGSP